MSQLHEVNQTELEHHHTQEKSLLEVYLKLCNIIFFISNMENTTVLAGFWVSDVLYHRAQCILVGLQLTLSSSLCQKAISRVS